MSSTLFYFLRNICQRSVFIWMLYSPLFYRQLWWSCLWLSSSVSLFWTSASPPFSLFLLLLLLNQEQQPGKSHLVDQETWTFAILLIHQVYQSIANYLGNWLLSVGWVEHIDLYDTSCITQYGDNFDWPFWFKTLWILKEGKTTKKSVMIYWS